MFETIIKIIIIVIGLPVMAFLCIKYGTAGYFKGKKFGKEDDRKVDVTTFGDKRRRYEKRL